MLELERFFQFARQGYRRHGRAQPRAVITLKYITQINVNISVVVRIHPDKKKFIK